MLKMQNIFIRKVVGGVVNLLPPEAFFNDMRIKVFLACSSKEPEPQNRVM